MKINEKIISIPPYISTTWNNVISLRMKESVMVVGLKNGDLVNIPDLSPEFVEQAFEAHVAFMEKPSSTAAPFPRTEIDQTKIANMFTQPGVIGQDQQLNSPFRLGVGTADGLGIALQHNPAQANMPDLPPEVLAKIGAISKIVSPEDVLGMPKPEPDCNCMHCQISSAVHKATKQLIENEEVISDEELSFQQWDILQAGDNLFNVVNRLDTKEKYSVYLGNPLGCTCGKENCEHIIAVLKS